MDELQSWWEVPAIAHFCYAFREVFNIIYFEIAELESAILNVQDPEMSISLEQLIIRLLQGCFDENEVTNDNWEEKLNELFEENCEEVNPLEGACFHFLPPRSKVEVLHKLCEFRLDAEGSLDAIKDIPADDMKATCVGKDSQNNLYWYFCDERLYKEDPSVKPNKKTVIPEKNVNKNSTAKVKNRVNTRERKPVVTENKQWTITCHNTSDWEELVKRFSKSKNNNEKELVNHIKNKYLPLLKDVVSEKDRLLRKRFLELAPKRNSSRISKVQAQKRLEEQKAAEAAEAKRAQQEAERVKKEAEKKKNEKEERQRRAEERQKVIQGRSVRAKQREMMRGYSTDDSESSSELNNSRATRAKQACRSRKNEQNSSEESSSEDDNEASSNEDDKSVDSNKRNYESESANSSKNSSRHQSADENCSGSDSNDSSTVVHSIANSRVGRSVRASVVRNTYNSKCNVQVDSKKQKVSSSISYIPENKRLKTNDVSNYKTVNNTPTKDSNTAYKEYHNFYLNSCSPKRTSSPNIIRIDFIKPPVKPQG